MEDERLSSSKFFSGFTVSSQPRSHLSGTMEEGVPQGSNGQMPAACPRPAPSTLAGSHTNFWRNQILLPGRRNLGEGLGASLSLAA